MATVKHAFTSPKSDGGDNTLVQPSNWNADHTVTVSATDKVLGRQSAGSGTMEEITCTSLGRSIIGATTIADLIAAGIPMLSTGDFKLTLKTTADAGYVMCDDGTIGNVSSGATTRANADCQALYTLIWNNVSDTYAPVTSGRGASASADWAAQKPMALTKMLGRAIAISGAGSGLTSRTLGQTLGEETHLLTTSEIPAHKHPAFIYDPTHVHGEYAGAAGAGSNMGAGASNTSGSPANLSTTASATGVRVKDGSSNLDTTDSTGGGGAHNVMQPTTFVNCMIKL
jgi:microcystin-dependent protein